jgi:DNA-binding NarL/FixJ family response regulator
VCRQIEETVPNAAVLVIGAFSDGMIIHNLFSRGVKGYLYRCDPLADTLPLALTAILKGRLYLSPTANAAYLVSIQGGQYARQLDDEARTVLQLLAEGCTVGEIAFQIRRSPRRVYWVRQKLRNWLGAATNEHLIQRAVEEGFICPVT